MPSFGEKLKQEREKRNISLEQISSSTKIGTRMLQALEEDKFNQLPGGIFNKGFVRAYSRCVGLDEEQTVAEYLQASGDVPLARADAGGHEAAGLEATGRENRARENEQNLRRLETISDDPARPLPWGLFAALLLLVALVLSLWSYRQRERARQSASPTATAAPPTGITSEAASGVVREDRGAGPLKSGSTTGSSPTNGSRTAPAPAATPGEFTVLIQAREESWISITADGKTTASELLIAGSERTVRGRKEIMVKVGNAGAVEFRFNGKKLETGGDFGEVKTVTFGPGGMLPTAPAP